MKYLNYLIIFIFLSFAFVQMNDPDPIKWIALYLSVIPLAILNIQQKNKTFYQHFHLGISTLIFCYYVFHYLNGKASIDLDFMSNENEMMRELFGTALVSLLSLFYWLKPKKST